VKNEKNLVVKTQNFEEAARLRDLEKRYQQDLEAAVSAWEVETGAQIYDVTEDDIADVVAMMTGIPVNKVAESESAKLLNMQEQLRGSVVGQDEAIEKLSKAIRRARAGLKDPNRPIGSFIFLGPTGVGKTELAKSLARYLFDTDESLIRIDMSEYMEKFSVSRLVGAPPGYVGYEEGGQLTEKVRRKPYSVVLLDEIEKAHPDVFNILLQVLDDGQLTDSLGRRVDFKNTIIIMTSNVGTKEIKKQARIGFGESAGGTEHEKMKEQVDESMKRLFNPEFLNRIDDTIVFRHLEKDDIKQIIRISLNKLLKRVKEMGVDVQLSETALDFLADKGYDKTYGARPLKRAMQKFVEDPIAEEILKGTVKDGTLVKVDVAANGAELLFTVENKAVEPGEAPVAKPTASIDDVLKETGISGPPEEAPEHHEASTGHQSDVGGEAATV
jgi:ATP-dependent Clp protease ATP-binding subunit ClpC